MIGLGLDPGFAFFGIGVIEATASIMRVVHHETFKTTTRDDAIARLDAIADHLGDVIDEFRPEFIAYENQAIVEAGKHRMQRARAALGEDDQAASNFSSARVHEVTGIIRCAARFYSLPCYCLAPNTVKVALLGKGGGRAKKAQVKDAVHRIFRVIASEHAADAIAISVGGTRLHRQQVALLRSSSALIH